MSDVRRQRRPSPASRVGLQSCQFPAHAGDAGTDQGLVAVEPEREADQDRRQGHQPWPQHCFPDGRGRHSQATVPGDFAADCRAAAEAAPRTSMRLPMVMRSTAPDGRTTLSSSDPLPPLGDRMACDPPPTGPALRKAWKIATICLKFQVHPGNPGFKCRACVTPAHLWWLRSTGTRGFS